MSSDCSIGTAAFRGCSVLTKLVLPNELVVIPDNLCESCLGLKSITIPSSVLRIGSDAFKNAGLLAVTIPASVQDISSAFANCGDLQTASIPYGLKDNTTRFGGQTKVTVRNPSTASEKEMAQQEKDAILLSR